MKYRIFVIVLALVAMAAPVAMAETFKVAAPIQVTSTRDGQVIITGQKADIQHLRKLVQFCPDEFKRGCGNNIVLQPVQVTDNSVTFQLDMDALKDFNQRAFNAKWDRDWLLIPDANVNLGEHLKYEMSAPSPDSEDGKGGAHFTTTIIRYEGDRPSM